MTATIAQIWRYPIKSHGAEQIASAPVNPGQTLPGDRLWAVLHEAAKETGPGWVSCHNFTRVAKAPALAAIRASLSEGMARLRLSHPQRPDLELDPDTDEAAFLDWVAPLMEAGRASPVRLIRARDRGMTDSPAPTISLNNLTSHRAVGQKLGMDLDIRRWRGNIWLEGLGPWQEFEWIGRRLSLGTAELEVTERITRCLATAANPETGKRDADTLGALEEGWDHRDFGVYAVVTKPGTIRQGDTLTLL